MSPNIRKNRLIWGAILVSILGVMALNDVQAAPKSIIENTIRFETIEKPLNQSGRTSESTDSPTVRIDRSWVSLRQGPSTSFSIVDSVLADEVFIVVGRNTRGDWYEIVVTADLHGWIYADFVEVSGDVSNIPVSKPALTVADLQSPESQSDDDESTDDESTDDESTDDESTDDESTDVALVVTELANVELIAEGTDEREDALSIGPTLRVNQPLVNLRSGPGTTYAIVGSASANEQYDVVGRTKAGDWYYIHLSDDEEAWIYAGLTELSGELNDVDISESPRSTPDNPTEAPAPIAPNSSAIDAEPQTSTATEPQTVLPAEPSTVGLTGDLLYSLANLDDKRWELWAYSFEAGSSTKIGDWWTEIDVSRDGSQIVYFLWGTEGSDDTGIWIMDRDYTNNRLVVPGGAYPSFSPGGDRLVLNGGQDIYVINSDGGGLRGLTVGEYPAWSPVNDQVVHRACVGGACGLWLIDANSTDPNARSRVTTGASDGQPAWSPNGQRIAYISQDDGNFEIYVINADGSGKTRLTTDPASDGLPVWSPDGQWIAFRSDRGGSWAIYAMRADGSDLRKIIDADVLPAWFFEKMDWF